MPQRIPGPFRLWDWMQRKRTRRRRRPWLLAVGGTAVLGLGVLTAVDGNDTGAGEPPRPVRTGCEPGVEGVATHATAPDRRVALTFDDGPSDYTPGVLRALRRHGAHATFFVVGDRILGNEAVLQRMISDGHEIGNHSMVHMPSPSSADLADSQRLIEDVSGFRPCHFRPPGGQVDDALIERARDLGMATVTWSVDTGDWANQDPDAILAGVLDVVEPGSIVLLHDGGGDRSGTAAVAPELIDQLKERGYELVTVTELLDGRFILTPSPS
jgi:peptidoglycan/xylan/chitin deacetylase (PgdA/CDA1 family)